MQRSSERTLCWMHHMSSRTCLGLMPSPLNQNTYMNLLLQTIVQLHLLIGHLRKSQGRKVRYTLEKKSFCLMFVQDSPSQPSTVTCAIRSASPSGGPSTGAVGTTMTGIIGIHIGSLGIRTDSCMIKRADEVVSGYFLISFCVQVICEWVLSHIYVSDVFDTMFCI